MSLNQPLLLDIELPAKELLLQKFNLANSLMLSLDDYDFGEPSVFVPTKPGSLLNTKVTLTPKLGSRFYNPFDLWFTRMDIATILNNPAVTVPRDSAVMLSDVVASINQLYGIKLTPLDYTEQVLPTLDPLDPNASVDVVVQIKPTSLLFFGNYTLTLNRTSGSGGGVEVGAEPALVYVLVNQEHEPVEKDTVVCVTSDGVPVSNFNFLRNAITKTEITIDKLFALPNNDLVVQGYFQFTMMSGGVETSVESWCMTISPNGAVKDYNDIGNDFGHDEDQSLVYASYKGGDKIYSVLNDVPVRFDLNGGRDGGYSAATLPYRPVSMKVDSAQRLYTVSGIYEGEYDDDANPNTPLALGSMVRIDRLLPTGAVDTTFTPIVIRHTSGDPWRVGGLALAETRDGVPDGIYLSLIPTGPLSSYHEAPIINNVPVTDPIAVGEFTYVPVFKFHENGTWDRTFVHYQSRYKSDAIYQVSGTKMVQGTSALGVFDKHPVWFTNRQNPMTGHIHHFPTRYSPTGALLPIDGDAYEVMPRWINASTLTVLSDGNILVSGNAYTVLPNGEWAVPKYIVASYNASTTPDTVIFESPTAGGNSQIKGFVAVEV